MYTNKRKFFKTFVFVAISLLFFLGCEKDEKIQLNSLVVFDINDESDWNYMAVGGDGSYLLISEQNGVPDELFIRPESTHDGYSVKLDSSGLPRYAVIDNHIFIFKNISGAKVDIAVISPDGSIEIVRDIDTGVDNNSFSIKNDNQIKGWNTFWSVVGHGAGVAACGIGIATAVTGVGIAIAAVGCTATAVGLVAEVVPDDTQILGLSSTTIGTISTIAGCAPPPTVDCVLGGVSSATSISLYAYDYLAQNEELVNIAEGVLKGGYGDIQVTLTWDSVCDLDLWVTDPYGETIRWNNPTSASGGYLDFDNTYGYGPENIFWPDGMAPPGKYSVHVDYFSGSGVSTYSVLIIVGDEVLNNGQPITGQISPNQTLHVADFTYGNNNEQAIVLHEDSLNNQLQQPAKTKTE